MTQLIARRVRETGVYCEIHALQRRPTRRITRLRAQGDHPLRRRRLGAPRTTRRARRRWCSSWACRCSASATASRRCAPSSAARSSRSDHREFGRAFIEVTERLRAVRRPVDQGRARAGVDEPRRPRDRAPARLPRGRGQRGRALRRDRRRRRGASTASSSTPRSCTRRSGAHAAARTSPTASPAAAATGPWRPSASEAIARIRAQVGKGRVICGLSGGVDSSVAAVLIHEAIGDQLTCIFVDHGLLRQGEAEEVRAPVPRPLQHPAGPPRRRATCSSASSPASATPSRSARSSAPPSSTCSTRRRSKIGGAEFLAQGTLYPDVIEIVSFTGGPSVTIKSHHNVGGLPERMKLKLVEPLRELFKDEVRALGRELGLPETLGRPPPVPRPGPRHPHPRRDHAREARRSCARPTRSISRRSTTPASTTRSGRPSPCCCRCSTVGVMGDAPHLRPRLRAARRHLDRRHDRRLLPVRARRSSAASPPASSTRCAASTAWSTTCTSKPPGTIEAYDVTSKPPGRSSGSEILPI